MMVPDRGPVCPRANQKLRLVYNQYLLCGQVRPHTLRGFHIQIASRLWSMRQDSTWIIAVSNQSASTLWSINFRVSADPEALFKEKLGVWNLYARAGFDLTLSL
jgi:hypothetical protein